MQKLIKEGLKEFIVTSLIEKQYNFVDVKDEDLEDTIDIIKNKMNKENEEKVHKDETKAFKLQQKEFVSLFKEHTKAFFGQHGLTVINKLKKSISKSMPKEWKTQVLKTLDKHDIITTTSSAQKILFAELSNLDSLNISKPEVLSSTKAEHAQEEEPSTVELDDVIPFVSEQSKNDSESFFQQANLPDDQKTVVNDNGKAPSHLLLDSSITTDTDGLNNGVNKAVLIDINDFMANSSFNLDNMFANNEGDTLSVFEKSNDEYLDKDFDEYDDNSSVGNSADKDMTSEENLTPVVNFKD
jgi:hypothetical protein